MIKKSISFILIILLIIHIQSCGVKFSKSQYYSTDYKTGNLDKKTGLGFEFPDKYDIDIFFQNEEKKPPMGYEIIEEIEVTGENPISEEDTKTGRMLIDGNSEKMKKELLQQLVEKTLVLGGTALMDVKYSFFTSQYSSGYSLKGKAIRYKLN